MAKTKLGKYYINKEKVIADFGSIKAIIEKFGLNWKKTTYGVENIKCFKNLPREYILERDATPRIFIKKQVEFVKSEKEATHILKDYKGGIICKRIVG